MGAQPPRRWPRFFWRQVSRVQPGNQRYPGVNEQKDVENPWRNLRQMTKKVGKLHIEVFYKSSTGS